VLVVSFGAIVFDLVRRHRSGPLEEKES
jgi:hypothetical protein